MGLEPRGPSGFTVGDHDVEEFGTTERSELGASRVIADHGEPASRRAEPRQLEEQISAAKPPQPFSRAFEHPLPHVLCHPIGILVQSGCGALELQSERVLGGRVLCMAQPLVLGAKTAQDRQRAPPADRELPGHGQFDGGCPVQGPVQIDEPGVVFSLHDASVPRMDAGEALDRQVLTSARRASK